MTESSIVRACLKALNAIPGCKAVKVHGNAYTRAGTPDLDVCYRGQAYKLEVKVPGARPTPIQVHELAEWARAGAVTGVVYSADEALALVLRR